MSPHHIDGIPSYYDPMLDSAVGKKNCLPSTLAVPPVYVEAVREVLDKLRQHLLDMGLSDNGPAVCLVALALARLPAEKGA